MARFGGVGTDREAHVSDEMWALSREPTLTGSERIVGNSETILPNDNPNLASKYTKNGFLSNFAGKLSATFQALSVQNMYEGFVDVLESQESGI